MKAPDIPIARTIPSLRRILNGVRRKENSIGLVPTMGALHQGHLDLVKASTRKTDFTVVSIFVNPLQFGKNEDLDKYPRRLREDAQACARAGAHLIFAPEIDAMYSGDHQTFVINPDLENLYCGQYRPGHFRGVLTVVSKLFLAVEPDWAFFGKKDYQQARMIANMVRDLNWKLRIGLIPTRREPSGLAMSSRNEYLSQEERQNASAIYAGLLEARGLYRNGERSKTRLLSIVREKIERSGGRVQYAEIARQDTLLPFAEETISDAAVILIAAFYGSTRLIDNIELP